MNIQEYLNESEVIPKILHEYENLTAGFVWRKVVEYLKTTPQFERSSEITMPSARSISKKIGMNHHTYLKALHRLNELGFIKILNEGRPEKMKLRVTYFEVTRQVVEVNEKEDSMGEEKDNNQLYIIFNDSQKLKLYDSTLNKVKAMGATETDIKQAVEAANSYPYRISNLHKFFPSLFDSKTGRCIAFNKKEGIKIDKTSPIYLYDKILIYLQTNEEFSINDLQTTVQKLSDGEWVDRAELPIRTLVNYAQCFEGEQDCVRLDSRREVLYLGDSVKERKGCWCFPFKKEFDRTNFWSRLRLPSERKRTNGVNILGAIMNGSGPRVSSEATLLNSTAEAE